MNSESSDCSMSSERSYLNERSLLLGDFKSTDRYNAGVPSNLLTVDKLGGLKSVPFAKCSIIVLSESMVKLLKQLNCNLLLNNKIEKWILHWYFK